MQSAQAQAAQAVEAYIAEHLTDPTVGDVIGGRRTIVAEDTRLPSALANRIVFEGATYDTLPDALRLHLTLAVDRLGDPIRPQRWRWSALNNRQLTLSFRPASAADEAALAALLPDGEITDLSQLPDAIPGYLIAVIPELKLEGEVIHSGSALRLGEEMSLSYGLTTPLQRLPTKRYSVIAGSYLALTPAGGHVAPAALERVRAALEQTKGLLETQDPAQLAALTREALLGDLFHAGLLGYWAQYTALGHLAALGQRAATSLAAGFGSFGYEPVVETFFGIPRSLRPGGVAMNLYVTNYTATHAVDAAVHRLLNLQLGALSSALEHTVPEQLFATDPENPPDAVSAVKALSKASAEGQRIYQITQDNLAQALPNLHLAAATEEEISRAVRAGKWVITHTDPIAVPGWSGAGYVILDPETGIGAWKIGGGGNGGFIAGVLMAQSFVLFFAACFSYVPLSAPLALGTLIGIFGSILVSTVLVAIYGDDPVFWNCFWTGFAVLFAVVSIHQSSTSLAVALAIGSMLGIPYAVGSCFL